MLINEIISNIKLSEGPNDPHIFKAVFLAGGPGSGKSYVAGKLLSGYGLKTVNSDDIYEYLAIKANLDLSDPDQVYSDKGQEVRNRAKELTMSKQASHIDGRLGLVIDGTGKDVAKVQKQSELLRQLGYETIMLFVNTSEDVAQQRNKQRDRRLPDGVVSKMWAQVQDNIMGFQQVFGNKNFYVVDNSGGLEDPERGKSFDEIYKDIRTWVNTPTRNREANAWLANQQQDRAKSDK
jgi:predicted kinase